MWFETPSLFSICISASHFLSFFHLLSNLLYKSPNHLLSDLCFNCSTAVICTPRCFTVGIKWIQSVKNKTNLETEKKKRMKFGKWSLMSFPARKAPPRFSFFFSLYTLLLDLSDFSSFWFVSKFGLSETPHALLSSPMRDSSTNGFKGGKMHTSHKYLNTCMHKCAHSTSIINTDLEVLGKIKYWIDASNTHLRLLLKNIVNGPKWPL